MNPICEECGVVCRVCTKCNSEFICLCEDERGAKHRCPPELKSITYDDVAEVGSIWKTKHDNGEITDNEYDQVAEAFGMLYKKLR